MRTVVVVSDGSDRGVSRDDVPKSVRVRTDPEDSLAHRYDAIQSAADYWGCNKSDAIVKSCDAVGRLVENLEAALQHEDLPPRVAQEIAEQVSTRQIDVHYYPPSVDVDEPAPDS